MAYVVAILIIMPGVEWTVTANFDTMELCQAARSEFIAAAPFEGAGVVSISPCTSA